MPIPSVIEYDNNIIMIVMNDGMAFFMCLKSTFFMFDIIITPTYIRALAADADGINANSGKRKIESRKRIAVVSDVSPVLPPAEIPVLLSTNVDTVLVPKKAPTIDDELSAYIISPKFIGFPCSSTSPAFLLQPIIVPMVSNISIRNSETISIMAVVIDPFGKMNPPFSIEANTEFLFDRLK